MLDYSHVDVKALRENTVLFIVLEKSLTSVCVEQLSSKYAYPLDLYR
jgi:hypothetical protein